MARDQRSGGGEVEVVVVGGREEGEREPVYR